MSQVVIGDIIPYTQATAILNQTVFMTNWTANVESDVVVYQTPAGDPPNDVTQILPYPAGYSVVFIGALEQVQVTLVTPAGAGDIVTIIRDTPADRLNLYTNTNFLPSMLNNDFGILTLVDQQAQLVDQKIGPRYNYSAIIKDVIDTILPILGPNEVWMMNDTNTEIIGVEIPNSGFAPLDMTYLTATDESAFLTNSFQLLAGSGVTFTPGVNTITISSTGGTVVSLTPSTGITLTPNPITSAGTIGLTVPVAISSGGTGVTSVTTAPTASAWAGWDVNKNMSGNNFLPGYTTTVTAAGTTTLTVASTYNQFFTGSTTQTVVMPVTSTLVLGQTYYIVNSSSGNLTIQSSGGNTILTMTQDTEAYLTCILTSGTGTASWYFSFLNKVESAGTVVSVGSGTGLTGGPITTSGTLSFASIAAHSLWANVTAGAAVPTVVGTNTFIQQVTTQVISATATYTPTTGMVFCTVEIVGGGSGGGGVGATNVANMAAGGGGGGGGYSRRTYTATLLGASAAVVIGAGGAGGTAAASGTNGGNSTFTPAGAGTALSAGGGNGGALGNISATPIVSGAGGAGGNASGGQVNGFGGNGNDGIAVDITSASGVYGGNGGQSFFGSGAKGGSGDQGGQPSNTAGGGGAGAAANSTASTFNGGAGSNGVCIITEYIAL